MTMKLDRQERCVTEARPIEYVELDGETFSEYEIDPSFTPPEDKPAEMYLAEILHELRTIRYQVQALMGRVDSDS